LDLSASGQRRDSVAESTDQSSSQASPSPMAQHRQSTWRAGNDPSNRQRASSDGEDDRASTGEADDSPLAGGERS
jgi:hypothetical protein